MYTYVTTPQNYINQNAPIPLDTGKLQRADMMNSTIMYM